MLVCIAVFRFTCCKAKENPRYTGMPDPEFVRRQKTVEKVNMVYEQNPDEAIEMLNFLKGPAEVSTYEKQFIRERLNGKGYKARSFFAGATPENGYKPTIPYVISVSENPYSFDEENWATLYVTSGGADNPRPIKLRKKPSTGQWFLNDIQCLSDIRIPVEEDPWA